MREFEEWRDFVFFVVLDFLTGCVSACFTALLAGRVSDFITQCVAKSE